MAAATGAEEEAAGAALRLKEIGLLMGPRATTCEKRARVSCAIVAEHKQEAAYHGDSASSGAEDQILDLNVAFSRCRYRADGHDAVADLQMQARISCSRQT